MNEHLESWYDRQQKRDEDIRTSNEDELDETKIREQIAELEKKLETVKKTKK